MGSVLALLIHENQLGRLICNQGVRGSSPLAGTIIIAMT